MRVSLNFLIVLVIGMLISFSVTAAQKNERIIAGWLEMLVLSPWQIKLKAKLDSGAKTSSIHAENIERFEQDGKAWVRFDLPVTHKRKTVLRTIEAPLVREVKIKRHNLPSARRSVVELSFCINGHSYSTQFTLANRGNFNYPVLLGRRFLQGNILIDPAETFIHDSSDSEKFCSKPQADSEVGSASNHL